MLADRKRDAGECAAGAKDEALPLKSLVEMAAQPSKRGASGQPGQATDGILVIHHGQPAAQLGSSAAATMEGGIEAGARVSEEGIDEEEQLIQVT